VRYPAFRVKAKRTEPGGSVVPGRRFNRVRRVGTTGIQTQNARRFDGIAEIRTRNPHGTPCTPCTDTRVSVFVSAPDALYVCGYTIRHIYHACTYVFPRDSDFADLQMQIKDLPGRAARGREKRTPPAAPRRPPRFCASPPHFPSRNTVRRYRAVEVFKRVFQQRTVEVFLRADHSNGCREL